MSDESLPTRKPAWATEPTRPLHVVLAELEAAKQAEQRSPFTRAPEAVRRLLGELRLFKDKGASGV